MKLHGFRWPSLAIVALLLLAGCAGPAAEASRFPAFVYASAPTLDSYRAAAALPAQVTSRIPCYCGCVSPPDSHRHLRDCFYEADGSFSRHAAGCDLCGKIVLDVQQAHRQGKALKEIRAMIDTTYAEFGPPTATPPVEG